jgi:hypothetical protein
MTDDVGRQINVIHVLGSGGGDVQDVIQQVGANNSTLSWTVNWGSTTGQLTYQGCFTQTCLPGSAYAVSSIVFPADASGFASKYSFSYNTSGWGQLNSVTLPSGASVNYCYQFDTVTNLSPNPCSGLTTLNEYPLAPPRNPILRKIVNWCDESDQPGPVVPPASCPVSQTQYVWNYAFPYNPNTGSATTSSVTGPDGGTTTTVFNDITTVPTTPSPVAGLVTSIAYPDGSTVAQGWSKNAPYETTIGTNYSVANPFIASQTRTLAGASATATNSFVYDNNGNLLTEYESDWSTVGGTLPNHDPDVHYANSGLVGRGYAG